MITAVIYKDQNGIIHGFRLSGHARYSKKGSDIVCSAASLLVINTINSIEAFTDEKSDVTDDEKKGVIICAFPERKLGIVNKDADLLIKSMIFGLETLEEQFGKYIKITEEAPEC